MSKTMWFQLKGSRSEGLRFEPHTRSADEVDHYTQGKIKFLKSPLHFAWKSCTVCVELSNYFLFKMFSRTKWMF